MNNKFLPLIVILLVFVGSLGLFLKLQNRVIDLETLSIQGNDQLVGGITRVAIGTQTKWTTDLIPSSSFSVNLGSAANEPITLFAKNASLSENFAFNGEIKPDGSLCSNDEILKKTGANNWDCAADDDLPDAADYSNLTGGTGITNSPTGTINFDATELSALTWSAGGSSTFAWTINLSGTDPVLTFNSGNTTFTGSATTSVDFEAKGYASASQYFGAGVNTAGSCDDDGDKLEYDSVTGLFTCSTLADADIPDAITIAGGTIGLNNISSGVTWTTLGTLTIGDNGDRIDFDSSGWDIANSVATGLTISTNNVTGTWTTTGNLTIGDNGDDVIIDSDTWNVDSAGAFTGLTRLTTTGNFSGATASLSGNFQTSARIIGGSASHSFAGSIEPSATGLGSLGTTAKKWSQAVVNLIQAAVKFILPARTATNVNETGALAVDTASSSLNFHDSTAERVLKDVSCFSVYIEDPTSTNDDWIDRKRFNDPFTITSVQVVASGANSAGWNVYHGVPGTVTTTLFTVNKSASVKTFPTYTIFNDATLLDGEVLDVVITSNSATLQSFAPTICGRSVK